VKASRLPGIRWFFVAVGLLLFLSGLAGSLAYRSGLLGFTVLALVFYAGCSFIVWRIIRGRALSTVDRELADTRKEIHAYRNDLPLSEEIYETANAALENGDPVRAEMLADIALTLPAVENPVRTLLIRTRPDGSATGTLPPEYRRALETSLGRLSGYVDDDPDAILPQFERIRDDLDEQQFAVCDALCDALEAIEATTDPETRATLWGDVAEQAGLVAAFAESDLFPPGEAYPRRGSEDDHASDAVSASGYRSSATTVEPRACDRLDSRLADVVDPGQRDDRFRYASVFARVEELRAEVDRAEALLDDGQGFESQDRFRAATDALETVEDTATERGFTDLAAEAEELLSASRDGQKRAYQAAGSGGGQTAPGQADRTATVSFDGRPSAQQAPGGQVSDSLQAELPEHEVLEHVGSGGNADVHRVRLEDSGEVAALKVPQWQGTLSRTAAEAFVEEARTWDRLDDHEHVVSVRNFGIDPYPWMLLEFMNRGNLATHVDSLSPARGIRAIIDVCEATHHAHQHGVAHTDIKPENVMFTATDDGTTVKIGDWGLAQVMLEHSKSVEGMTPSYAAPEQVDPAAYGSTGPRTDVYQLGVTTYEVLTKQVPYDFDSPTAVMNAIVSKDLTPPSAHNENLGQAVDEVVLTAMATDKSDRYESVLYLRDALRKLLS
jgi:hypothetical protein